MACLKNLRTDLLNGANAGGTWSYLGFHPCDPEGTPGAGGTNPGTLSGDNPEIDPNDWIVGYYFFKYEGGQGDCADEVITVLQVLPKPCYPVPEDVSFCVGQYSGDINCIGLENMGANGGGCTFNYPANFGSCNPGREQDFYFNLSVTQDAGSPNNLPANWIANFDCGVTDQDLNDLPVGEYWINIEVSLKASAYTGFTLSCADCDPFEAVWKITVLNTFDAGEAVKLAVCN
jgi:hypothetical protein